jgi:hypothetical protein
MKREARKDMPIKKICVLTFCLLLFSLPGLAAGNSAYKVSSQVPLDSWAYPALDRVVALCWVKSGLAGTRPLTRLEAARLVGEASLNARLYYVPPQARQLLNRLKGEFRAELEYLVDENGTAEVPAKLLRAAELSYTYRDGKASVYPGTDAIQYALDYNRSGREYDNNNNVEFSVQTEARLLDSLLLTFRPLVSQRDDDDTSFDTLAATAALSFKGVELSVGRQSLWWGPGRHGSLLLSNNAEPLDMVRLTNPSPLRLPWLFKYLGPFRFDLFASRLGEDRAVPEPYLGGLRINFKPAYWLELGATRTVMFGGKGQPDIDASDFLTILGGENLSGAEDTSNSIAGVDARLIFPLLWSAEIYGELAGEDEADALGLFPFFTKKSYLLGIYLPQIEPSGRFSLRVEYADTTQLGGGSPVFYRHGIYTSGYLYEDRIMGHHVGSDATDLSLELRADWSERLSFSLGFDYEQRGESLAVQEKHCQAEFSADWWANPNLVVSARYAFDRVENYGFVEGDEDFHMGSVGVGYRW